ncbi:MAG: aminocarboxymuconate-semialdehyde decarboxylase, partial [Betaproteobacteria bacterium]
MSTRRAFIKNTVGAVAGIAFTGCSLQAQQSELQTRVNGRRREVVVNGRRVKTVDVHAHCVIPEAMALMGRKIERAELDMARDRIAT